MTQNLTLSSTNLAQGTTLNIDMPSLQGGVLQVVSSKSAAHFLQLIDAVSDAGVSLTASATSGAMGISRTAGTSLTLVGEATSSSAKTDKCVFPFTLPSTYVAGSNFSISVNASVAGSGTLTGASTTLTVTPYYEAVGVETILTVSAAQQIVAAGSTLVFTVTGTAALTAGTQLMIELVALVTSASGSNTATINNISVLS